MRGATLMISSKLGWPLKSVSTQSAYCSETVVRLLIASGLEYCRERLWFDFVNPARCPALRIVCAVIPILSFDLSFQLYKMRIEPLMVVTIKCACQSKTLGAGGGM